MAKLQYLVIHTSDTPYHREITADDLTLWHLGAKAVGGGYYTFLGKKYTKQQLAHQTLTLPSGKKYTADRTSGNGWSKVGYSDLIQRSGNVVNLTPYDFNDEVDPWEVTNGVAGKNSVCRHVVLAGGWSKCGGNSQGGVDVIKNGINPVTKKFFKISDLYTQEQIESLVKYVRMMVENHPNIIVCGHNDLAAKSCPNFKVNEFCKDYGIKANVFINGKVVKIN